MTPDLERRLDALKKPEEQLPPGPPHTPSKAAASASSDDHLAFEKFIDLATEVKRLADQTRQQCERLHGAVAAIKTDLPAACVQATQPILQGTRPILARIEERMAAQEPILARTASETADCTGTMKVFCWLSGLSAILLGVVLWRLP
jgi:hypothetical protein